MPFGVSQALFLDGGTIAAVSAGTAVLIENGTARVFDAGLPVAITGVYTVPPDEVWWTTATGAIRFQGSTRTFIPGPQGQVGRGHEPGSFWLYSGDQASALGTAGWEAAEVPMGCPSRDLAPLDRDNAALLCDSSERLILQVRRGAPPLALYDGGFDAPVVRLLPLSRTSLLVASPGGPSGPMPTSFVLHIDGGVQPAPLLQNADEYRVSSDLQVFATNHLGVHRFVNTMWNLIASNGAFAGGQPVDLFNDALLLQGAGSLSSFEAGGTTTFVSSATTWTSCEGFERGPHVMFVCGNSRLDAPDGPLRPIAGSPSGQHLGLTSGGDLISYSLGSNLFSIMNSAGNLTSFNVPATLSLAVGAVASSGDMWVAGSTAFGPAAYFKRAGATGFNVIPGAAGGTTSAIKRWDALEVVGDSAWAAFEGRVIRFNTDGGFSAGPDAGQNAGINRLCVVNEDEYYLASTGGQIYSGRDSGIAAEAVLAGLRDLDCASGGIAAATNGSLIADRTDRSLWLNTPLPITADQLVLRENGDVWAVTTIGPQVMFRSIRRR